MMVGMCGGGGEVFVNIPSLPITAPLSMITPQYSILHSGSECQNGAIRTMCTIVLSQPYAISCIRSAWGGWGRGAR